MNTWPQQTHPQLETLPEWPARTIAVLATAGPAPHAIPVSAPVRADDRRILLSLQRSRGSLARLRTRPQVALLILTAGNIALTARGTAHIAEEPMQGAPEYAAIAIDVKEIDDHRQPEFVVEAGVDRRWIDEHERRALGGRVEALRALADRR
jgi:hypothetical protein